MKTFSGTALFLDRADINTDEIIPAKYLTENTKEALAPFLLEDLKLEGFTPGENIRDASVIVTRENFGCGSSREHAPWALEVNDINLVIAPSFARIFRQNMFNCGMMAVELPAETIDQLFSRFAGRPTTITTDFDKATLAITAGDVSEAVPFTISPFDRSLVEAGGWVDYADTNY
ncbi:MAG: 3-isopropylmalate dehydratase small subunit (EC 4.2.1.33) [Olavius algarvensis Delta 4 endosymbiont]|nr:MAG: 3-isopropylmalate dehydratase small subunit (EC 4.2.1.33) [Olavius algarvensis Delta 4 endosymbiont]